MSSEDVWEHLERLGWQVKKNSLTTSEVTFENEFMEGDITIPLGKKEVPSGILNEIFKKAGLL
jgi:predicted RNA binding protein YcfA (HicA-like mRNA interferase family)